MAAKTRGTHATSTSIFTDDSGRRSVRATWAVRVVSATLVIGVGAIVLSLFTHVSLPGLGLPDPLSGGTDTSVQEPRSSKIPAPSSTTNSTVSPSASSTRPVSAQGSGSTTTPRQSIDTTRAPTATPTPAATTSGKAADAPRAAPSHAPGTPPTAPPGKSK